MEFKDVDNITLSASILKQIVTVAVTIDIPQTLQSMLMKQFKNQPLRKIVYAA